LGNISGERRSKNAFILQTALGNYSLRNIHVLPLTEPMSWHYEQAMETPPRADFRIVLIGGMRARFPP
jgi:hypothetical protein